MAWRRSLSHIENKQGRADPGFPRGRSQFQGGTLTYHLANFFIKLHENKENWTEREKGRVQNFTK